MMTETVELLSPPTNFAIVRLPSRRYPGVVVQGDTLHALVSSLKQLRKEFSGANEETSILLEDVIEQLQSAQTFYESVCKDRGIDLPYREERD